MGSRPNRLRKTFPSLSLIKIGTPGMSESPLMSWDDDITFSPVICYTFSYPSQNGFWQKCFCPLHGLNQTPDSTRLGTASLTVSLFYFPDTLNHVWDIFSQGVFVTERRMSPFSLMKINFGDNTPGEKMCRIKMGCGLCIRSFDGYMGRTTEGT